MLRNSVPLIYTARKWFQNATSIDYLSILASAFVEGIYKGAIEKNHN